MAPPNAAGTWKPEIGVAPNGIRGPAAFGQVSNAASVFTSVFRKACAVII